MIMMMMCKTVDDNLREEMNIKLYGFMIRDN